MKKRIVAMLLALIMLLGLLPMSVFAVDADAGLNDTGDNEAVGYDTGDGNVNPIDTGNSVPKAPIATKLLQTVYFICSGGETISPATDVKVLNSGIQKGTTYRADVDKDFLNAVLNEKGLSDHTLGNYTTSVTYSWNTDKQTWETSDTVSVNLTHPPIEIDPDVIPAPTKPSKPKLSEEGSPVLVHCENRSNEHASTSCQDIYLDTTNSARYTEVTVNGENVWKDADGEWTYRIKLNKDEYIKAFNKNPNINTTHTDTNPGEETYVTWKHDGTSWKLVLAAGQSAGVGAVINVKCTPVPTSDEPTLANTDLKLIVKCVTNKAAHSERSMPLKAGTFKMNGTVQDRSQLKFCTIEVETAQYVAEFDTGHTAKQPSLTITLYQNPTTGRWNNNQTLGTVDNVIEVTCEPEAPTADELKKLEMAVQVKCVVDELQQHKDGYDLLGEYNKDYFVNEPRKVGDDWFCDISYIPDLYVAKFNKAFPNLKHVQNIEKIDPVTLRWDGNSWQPKKQGLVPVTEVYTVTFDSNGGTPVPPKKEVEYGLTATEPAAPEKTGYTFDGWYLGDEKYDFSAAVKQNITLKAKWSPATVYLFVQPVDSGNNPLTGKNALNAATLARAGFKASTFGGYNYSNKEWITVGKMTTALKLPTYKSVTDITGIWLDAVKGELKNGTYTPHANAADFNAKSQGCVDWNNLKYMPASCSHYGYPGKSEGYHLDGKLTFYWVKFDGNGATPESMPKNNYGDVYDYYITGGKVTMPAAPTRDGYTFDGWYLDGAEAPFDFNSTITSDITLTAKWKLNTYTLCTTLKLNGSDTAYKVPDRDFSWTYRESGEKDTDINYASFKNVLAAKAREIDAANSPSEKQIDIVFSVGKIADVEQEIKKYGQEGINWQPNNKNTAYVSASVYTYYDVTFMDGDTTLGTKTVKCGDTVSFADPTKNGYNFTGWYTAAEGGDKVELTTPVTKSMTLYAHWTPNTYRYEIHYFLQAPDGSYVEKEVDKTPTGVFDTTVTITPDANKYGAHYPYNSVKSVVSGVVTVDDPATILKLYVYYDLDFHTLTFDTMGGSRIDPVKVRHGNAVAKPKDPVNGGYWFDGWYTDKTYRTPYNFATPLTQDTTIYAKWFLIVLPGVTIKKATPKLNTYDHFAYVQGYPDGSFRPRANITRAEFAAMAVRFFDVEYDGPDLFSDTTGHWASDLINKAASAGIILGFKDGTFRPDQDITRAEAIAIFNRVLGRAPDKDHLLPDMITWPDNMDTDAWYYANMQEATNSHDYDRVKAADGTEYEVWTKILPVRDWAAFETEWATAGSAKNPGDVYSSQP